jgi:hypothetical protein
MILKIKRMRINAETSSLLAAKKGRETDLDEAKSLRFQSLILRDIQKDVDEIGTWIYDIGELRLFAGITQAPALMLILQVLFSLILK